MLLVLVVLFNYAVVGYDVSHTDFTRMPAWYFRRYYLSTEIPEPTPYWQDSDYSDETDYTDNAFPKNFSYLEKCFVTGVKDQGLTETCGIFAAVAALETTRRINRMPLSVLSEQAVYDCMTEKGPYRQEKVLKVLKASGTTLQKFCKWKKGQQNQCLRWKKKVNITKFEVIKASKEDRIRNHLWATSPVIISVLANDEWQTYKGEIMEAKKYCKPVKPGQNETFHAVLLTGYATENGVRYMEFKNSWGPRWGREGYGRFRGDINFCNYLKQSPYHVFT